MSGGAAAAAAAAAPAAGATTESVLDNPLWCALQRGGARRVFIVGCGGGYDMFSGVPLFYAIRERLGKDNVFIGNLAFTAQPGELSPPPETYGRCCYGVTAAAKSQLAASHSYYFPEKQFATWHEKKHGDAITVFTFVRSGVKHYTEAMTAVCTKHNVDTIILVDGGTDSLCKGDEQGVGTPSEDSLSMISVDNCRRNGVVKNTLLVALGWGIDHFHGVNGVNVLENIGELTRSGHFLGAFTLHRNHHEAALLLDAYENCKPANSIVTSSVASAVAGGVGDVHHPATADRTRGSKLFISAMMTLYWVAQLDGVVANMRYAHRCRDSKSYSEHVAGIREWRDEHEKQLRAPQQFPH